jgi:predicted nucleic acid-binding Zn ribbon protein
VTDVPDRSGIISPGAAEASDRPDGSSAPETHATRPGIEVAREALAAARAAAAARGVTARKRSGTKAPDPTRRSAAGPDDRDPQLLGRTIERLVAARGWETDVAVGGVIGRWDAVVGPELAAHCRAESFRDAELTVVTDTTAWATQVRLLAPALIRRLNSELGDGTVVRVRVVGPSAPSWRKGPLSVRGRGPRDTYG